MFSSLLVLVVGLSGAALATASDPLFPILRTLAPHGVPREPSVNGSAPPKEAVLPTRVEQAKFFGKTPAAPPVLESQKPYPTLTTLAIIRTRHQTTQNAVNDPLRAPFPIWQMSSERCATFHWGTAFRIRVE
jgi:hypothetical protein